MVMVFHGAKAAGCDVDHPTPPSVEVEERVAIPLLPLWAFVACLLYSNYTINYSSKLMVSVLATTIFTTQM